MMHIHIIVRKGRVIVYAKRCENPKIVNDVVESLEEKGVKIVNILPDLHCG